MWPATVECWWQGYNHPALLSAFSTPDSLAVLANRPALGVYPGHDWVTQLRSVLLAAAPPGLDQVTTMMCGSCSNENAFKLMHFKVSIISIQSSSSVLILVYEQNTRRTRLQPRGDRVLHDQQGAGHPQPLCPLFPRRLPRADSGLSGLHSLQVHPQDWRPPVSLASGELPKVLDITTYRHTYLCGLFHQFN